MKKKPLTDTQRTTIVATLCAKAHEIESGSDDVGAYYHVGNSTGISDVVDVADAAAGAADKLLPDADRALLPDSDRAWSESTPLIAWGVCVPIEVAQITKEIETPHGEVDSEVVWELRPVNNPPPAPEKLWRCPECCDDYPGNAPESGLCNLCAGGEP